MKLKLLTIRKSKGYSQKEFAKTINVSIPTVSRYENGTRTPSIKTAKRIAEALSCTIDDLFAEQVESK